MTLLRFGFVATVLLLLVPAAGNAQSPGVTDDTILLGQSAAFGGPAAALGKSMRDGAMVYFDRVNAQGGIYGRKIKLLSLDDGYEPDRAIANTRKLINQDKVFALFGYVGTPTSYAVKPIITEAKIPFFGPFTGAEGLRNPVNRYIFNIRASYFDETEKLVDWMVSDRKTNIAVFYQDDAYGKAGLEGVRRAMEKRRLRISATGTVQRNTVDVAGAVKSIAPAKPQAIIMISAYKSCAAFIKEFNKTRQRPTYMNVSFVGSKALADELGPEGHGVIISQVVPFPLYPWGAALEMRNMLSERAPGTKPTFNDVEGFLAAKGIVEGLRRAGRDLTREKFISALETMRNVDLGAFPITFTPKSHSGSQFVELTVIIGGGGDFPFLPLHRAGSEPVRTAR
jgi:ABC-type branched-subunit amino acid transport system substrate-binding protein